MKSFWFLIAAVFLMTGCADVQVKKVTSDSQEGIRFYRPHPYLLVTREKVQKPSDQPKPLAQKEKSKEGVRGKTVASTPPPSADNVTTYIQVVWLPDKSENYAIKTKSGFGTVDATVKLDNGWQLTQFGGKIDSKVPETITAATGFLKALPGLTMGMIEKEGEAPAKPEMIPPGLYRLEFDEIKGWVIGASRVFP